MRRIVAAVLILAGLQVAGSALDENDASGDVVGVEADGCPPQPLVKAKSVVKEAWDREGWRQRNPVKKEQAQELERLRACMSGASKKKLVAYAAKRKGDFKFHRTYRSVAPFAGFSGEGYMLRWLAVPRYIVACETNGYSGEGRWHATNGSTNGPYQFIGWPVPWPARTDADKLAHHKMASQLGLSNWACA